METKYLNLKELSVLKSTMEDALELFRSRDFTALAEDQISLQIKSKIKRQDTLAFRLNETNKLINSLETKHIGYTASFIALSKKLAEKTAELSALSTKFESAERQRLVELQELSDAKQTLSLDERSYNEVTYEVESLRKQLLTEKSAVIAFDNTILSLQTKQEKAIDSFFPKSILDWVDEPLVITKKGFFNPGNAMFDNTTQTANEWIVANEPKLIDGQIAIPGSYNLGTNNGKISNVLSDLSKSMKTDFLNGIAYTLRRSDFGIVKVYEDANDKQWFLRGYAFACSSIFLYKMSRTTGENHVLKTPLGLRIETARVRGTLAPGLKYDGQSAIPIRMLNDQTLIASLVFALHPMMNIQPSEKLYKLYARKESAETMTDEELRKQLLILLHEFGSDICPTRPAYELIRHIITTN